MRECHGDAWLPNNVKAQQGPLCEFTLFARDVFWNY